MTTDHIPHLRSVESNGPQTRTDGYGEWEVATPCGGCQRVTAPGELITKYRRTWWHQTCAVRDVAAGNARAAWIALGHDLARSPRAYNVRESRAIVGALLGMIHDPDLYDEDDETVAS